MNLHIAPYYLYTDFQNALKSDYIRILSANDPIRSNRAGDFWSSEQMEHVRGLMHAIRGEKVLICTTDDSILEITTRCGFNNTVNFCKIFKKYTNLSPGAFRK